MKILTTADIVAAGSVPPGFYALPPEDCVIEPVTRDGVLTGEFIFGGWCRDGYREFVLVALPTPA